MTVVVYGTMDVVMAGKSVLREECSHDVPEMSSAYRRAVTECGITALASVSLNTASIIASTAAPDYISWRVSGICYWLYCSASGCTVRISVKVTHFIPEVVISTYTAPGGNPRKRCRWSAGPQVARRMPSLTACPG